MTGLFTIIIPVYNVEPYLRKCLDSVVNQTCPDWECICVDDGSPDNCGAILDEYKASFKGPQRFEVIHQKNGGVSVARNVALDVAQGQWVQFLDSDDSLKLDFLEQLKSAIESHPNADTIEHSAIYCLNDGTQAIGSMDGRLPPEIVVAGEDVLADPFGRKYTNLARCSCYKIFRRSVVEENHLRFSSGIPISEDELFATQFYVYAKEVVVCPKVAGYLRIFRKGSALMTLSAEKLIPKLRSIDILHQTWKKHPSNGMTTRLSAQIVSLAYLGATESHDTRLKCIEALLQSKDFNTTGIRFLLGHGTWKARLFALTYYLSPHAMRRTLLLKLSPGK